MDYYEQTLYINMLQKLVSWFEKEKETYRKAGLVKLR